MKYEPIQIPEGISEADFIAATKREMERLMDRCWAELFGGSRADAEAEMMAEIERRFNQSREDTHE